MSVGKCKPAAIGIFMVLVPALDADINQPIAIKQGVGTVKVSAQTSQMTMRYSF